jgi:hypothetical protein
LLVDGMFKTEAPTPPAEGQPPAPDAKPKTTVDRFKALELAEQIVGKPDKPSVYEALFKSVNAGGPADPVKVAEALKDEEVRAIDQIKAQNNRDKLTPDEQAKLTQKLQDLRVACIRITPQRFRSTPPATAWPASSRRPSPPRPPTPTRSTPGSTTTGSSRTCSRPSPRPTPGPRAISSP